MRQRRLSWLAEACHGRLEGRDAEVTSIAVDSRVIEPRGLFVALMGERVDGHSFADAALARGAAGILVERASGMPSPRVIVPDARTALLAIAGRERADLSATVVGITGSVGKTSTKDLLHAILGGRYRVTASPRSFNTDIGVPLTLLAAPPETDVVVCEMGSRGPGHITTLTNAARPTVGVVTNVGMAHLETFGTVEAVAAAKAELIEALPADGAAILNADDAVVRGFVARSEARCVLYGFSADADVRGEGLLLDRSGHPSFDVRIGGESAHIVLGVPGQHMAQNALAATAAAYALGIGVDESAERLAEAEISPWRMDVRDTREGIRIVNDAYNANPSSMAAALRTTRWMAGEGRLIAVLGAMEELGTASAAEHERVGELAARLRVDRLIVVGKEARLVAIGATREGVEPERVTVCDTLDEAASAVRALAQPGDVILIKASRAVGLDRIAESLLAPVGAPASRSTVPSGEVRRGGRA